METVYEMRTIDEAIVFKPTLRVIDHLNAAEAFKPLAEHVRAAHHIVLDLSAVNFLNSVGLGAIVSLVKDVELNGGKLRLCGALPTVQALFRMVRLENIVPIDADLETALSALRYTHDGR